MSLQSNWTWLSSNISRVKSIKSLVVVLIAWLLALFFTVISIFLSHAIDSLPSAESVQGSSLLVDEIKILDNRQDHVLFVVVHRLLLNFAKNYLIDFLVISSIFLVQRVQVDDDRFIDQLTSRQDKRICTVEMRGRPRCNTTRLATKERLKRPFIILFFFTPTINVGSINTRYRR